MTKPENFTDPVAFRWFVRTFLVDVTRTKSFRHVLQKNKIIDDRYFLRKPEVKAEYAVYKLLSSDSWSRDMTQLHCTLAMVDAGDCQEYMEFVYELDNEIFITKRRYKKIQALVGEFGGILKLLTTAFVIVSFHNLKAVKKFFFVKIFSIKKSSLVEAAKRIGKKNVYVRKQRSRATTSKIKPKNDRELPSSLFQKQLIPFNISQPRPQKNLDEAILDKIDIYHLVKKMNFIEIIKKATLKQHHKVLLPLALLNSKKHGKPKSSHQSETHFLEGEWEKAFEDPEKAKKLNLADYQKIYLRLKKLKPKNTMERLYTKRVVGYLLPLFLPFKK